MTDTTSIKHPTPLTSGDFTAAEEPFALFGEWFAEAVKSEPNDPNAMALATVDPDGLPDVRMVLMKGYDADGFVFYSHIASAKGRELAANPKAALLFHWKSLRRQVRIRGNGDAGDGGGSRRLFRHAAEAGADRRLGQQAVAAAGEPVCLRAGDRAGRRQTHHRRGAASARMERLAHSRLFASSSGTTARSGCTTASNSAATGRCRPGRRCGSIPDVRTRLDQFKAERPACPLHPTRRGARCFLTGASRGIGHATAIRLLLGRLARHHLLAACLSGSVPVGRGSRGSHRGRPRRPRRHHARDLRDPQPAGERRTARAGQQRRDLAEGAMAAGGCGTMDTDIETWSHVFRVNFFAPIMMARGLIEELKRGQGLGGERHLDRGLPRPSVRRRRLCDLEGGAGVADAGDGVRFRPRRRPRQRDRAGRDRHLRSCRRAPRRSSSSRSRCIGSARRTRSRRSSMCCARKRSSYVNGAEIHINGGQHV